MCFAAGLVRRGSDPRVGVSDSTVATSREHGVSDLAGGGTRASGGGEQGESGPMAKCQPQGGWIPMPELTLCGVPGVLATLSTAALLLSFAGGTSQGAPSEPGRVEVRHDPAVFTASALLNLTDYDEENDEPLHPAGETVRQQMAKELPPELVAELKEFRAAHPVHFTRYIGFALSTEGPPSFTPLNVEEVAPKEGAVGARWHAVWHSHMASTREELGGLELLLKRTWGVPAVQRAFRDIEEEAVQHGMASAAALDRGIETAIEYLQADPSHLQMKHVIIPNMLMSRGAMGFPMGEDTFFTIESPTAGRLGPADSDPVGDPHEFLHTLVMPATREPGLLEEYPARFGGLFRRAMAYPLVAESYSSVEKWLDECLVKALACRIAYDKGRPLAPLSDPSCPLAVQEAVAGFLLQTWFYEKLGDYEQGGMSFAEWFRQTVEHTTEEAVLDHLEELGISVKE